MRANPPSIYRTMGECAVLAAVYTAAGIGGLHFAFFNSVVTTVWPPSGIALAALLLFGMRLAPGVAIGAFAVNLWSSGTVIGAFGVAIGNTLAVAVGVMALTRYFGFDSRMTRLRDIVVMLFVGAAASPLIAATIGPFMLMVGGAISPHEYPSVWLFWWLGDSLGVILFTPLILAWYKTSLQATSRDRLAIGLIIVQAFTAFLIFYGLLSEPFNTQRVTYALLPIVIWLALACPLRYTATANILLFFIAISGTAAGLGPYAAGDIVGNALSLHVFLVVVTYTTSLVAGVNAERIEALTRTRESADRFRNLLDLSADWYWEQDDQFRFTSRAGQGLENKGFRLDEGLGKTRWELDVEGMTEADWAPHKATLRAHRPFRDFVLRRRNSDGKLLYVSQSGEPVFDKEGRFKGFRGVGRDITERELAQRALQESEARFRSLTELSSDWYWEQDPELNFTFVSDAIYAVSSIDASLRRGRKRWEIPGLRFDPVTLEEHKKLLSERMPFRDFRYIRVMPDGHPRHISVTGAPLFDSDGKFTGYRGVGREVTAEVTAEQRLARLRDFYAALSKGNNAIIHATNERQLFDEVCNIAVTYGRVIFARICLINRQTGVLDDIAIAGNHKAYSGRVPISTDPDRPEGRGPTAIALRTNVPDVCNDIESDPRNELWRPSMMHAGVRSYVVFPLSRNSEVVGSMHIYAAEKNWFDDDLVALITELSANLSFALDNFSREQARRSAELALRASEQRFRDFAEAAGEFVWENDLEGRFTYVSPRVLEYTGYAPEELVGHTAIEFMPPGEGVRVRQWLTENMNADRAIRGMEHMFLSKSGEILWMQVSAVSIWDENGRPLGQRGTTRDISSVKRSEARISYLATRDPLTELPNRLLFNDRLEQGLIAARRKRDKLGVLFLDLDRFKNINDSLGHHIGDLLLKEIALRMAACIRKGDTLSRLGGDEFVVTLEGLAQAEDAAQVALKIISTMRKPVDVDGHTLNTSCSVGISIFPDDAENSLELMKNADTAMYHAKEQGRNNFKFFSPEMNQRAVERHRLETELRLAIEQEQFVLHYQPQADLRTGRLIGMEALIRWQHPERGLVPPMSFIPVAEESGLIDLIGGWALRSACAQNRAWQQAGFPRLKVAVNISARQLDDPDALADEVMKLLGETHLDAQYLELEMTESVLLKNVNENVAVLRRLGQAGVRMAVDDFGTGYSSLAYLKQLPIDTLKIDRSFVRDIETDPDDAAIIQAIIAMAHGLDLRVTAEGVETAGQLAALRKLGCDEFQGYLLAKPLPTADFLTTLLEPLRADR
ncbi:MAG: EAL domain-containing protein [Betaproteobacteria bacterium]